MSISEHSTETSSYPCKDLFIDGKHHSESCTLYRQKTYLHPKTKDGNHPPMLISQSWNISTPNSLFNYMLEKKNHAIICKNLKTGVKYSGSAIIIHTNTIDGSGELNEE